MQVIGLPIDLWETPASDRYAWKTSCKEDLREGEKRFCTSQLIPGENVERPGPLLHPLIPTMSVILVAAFVDQELGSKAISENV